MGRAGFRVYLGFRVQGSGLCRDIERVLGPSRTENNFASSYLVHPNPAPSSQGRVGLCFQGFGSTGFRV